MVADLREMQENQRFSEIRIDKLEFRHMEDVNHKYPKTTIPNTMIAVVMIPATFFFLTNAIAVMIISSTYTIANQAVNPICNISSNSEFVNLQ